MNKDDILFQEKQYMGHNRLSIVIRTMLALFCFLGYYWSENPNPIQVSFFKIGSYPIRQFSNSGLLFFILGVSILVMSAGLTYIYQIKTNVYKSGFVVLDGFWTSRKVRIDLSKIKAIRKSRYKKNVLRRAVYNLHNSGMVRFYSSGEDFVELIDTQGFIYRIGSQKALELFNILKAQVKG